MAHPLTLEDCRAVLVARGAHTQIRLRVVPRASTNAVAGRHGDALKVRVQAPPADGAANAAVVEVLAAALGCSASEIEFVRGRTSRDKVVAVALGADEVASRLVAG